MLVFVGVSQTIELARIIAPVVVYAMTPPVTRRVAAVAVAFVMATTLVQGLDGRLETGEEKGQEYFSIQSGTVTAAEITQQLQDFHETAEGVPLWTVVLIPPDITDESCHYNMLVPQLYPVTRDVQKYARAEMMRLISAPGDDDDDAHAKSMYADQEHLFNNILGIPTPTQEQVGCMAILRYNAMVSDADLQIRSGGATTSKDGDDDGSTGAPTPRVSNPDVVRVPGGTRKIDRDTFIRFVLDSYAYKGMHIPDVDGLRAFGETYMPMGYVPVVMYLNTTAQDGGDDDEQSGGGVSIKRDNHMSMQMWAAMSSLTDLNTVFAFGVTSDETIFNETIPVDENGIRESPAFMAVIPKIGDAVVFPEPELGDDLKLLTFTVETLSRPDREVFEKASKRSAVALAFVDHVHESLMDIKGRTPTTTRDKFVAAMQERARKAEEAVANADVNDNAADAKEKDADGGGDGDAEL